MSAQSFEVTLARLYTDPSFRHSFLSNPVNALKDCDLTELERLDFMAIDKAGLLLASHSFYHKRQKRISSRSLWDRWKIFVRLGSRTNV